MERTNILGWRPALDGLRGIAVVAVVLFHFNTQPLLPGGSFGVDLFFALSGFLITSLLVEEWQRSGSLSLSWFYLRRLLRLAPALFVFVGVVTFIQIAFRDAAFTREPSVGNTLANAGFAVTYFYNWPTAFDMVYSPALGHLWTLSIEEQFYLLWPAALAVMLRCGASFKVVLVVLAALAALSASVPLVAGNDWRRLYFGSDYRAHGLLIGSMAGMLFASGLVHREHVRQPLYYVSVSLASLYLATLMLFSTDRAVFLFRFGYPAISVSCSLIVLAGAFVDGGLPMRVLGNGVLTYIGKRSYAIYLWHFPMDLWFRHLDAPVQLLVAGSLTLLAAELSHRIVERPALSLKHRFARGRPESSPLSSPEPIFGVEPAPGRAAA